MAINHSQISSLDKYSVYMAEALFGFKYVHKYIEELPSGSNVLEIGSGPCILIDMLSEKYKSHNFMGVEPIGDGFDFFSIYHQNLQKSKNSFSMHYAGYETLTADTKWDLIFLVNVFEHLPDWRHFLNFVRNHLAENGKCIILCPNYSFPYEPHFALPILFNKKITYFLFRKLIHSFEVKNNCVGLWKSLNFVSYASVKSFSKKNRLNVISKNSIAIDMLNRLEDEPDFARRHRAITFFAKIFFSLNMDRFIKVRLFSYVLPYMYLEIKRI